MTSSASSQLRAGLASDASGAAVAWGLQACESPAQGPWTEEEVATLGLFCIEGIGSVTLAGLRQALGSLAAVLSEPRARVAPLLKDRATRARFEAVADVRALGLRALEAADKAGACVLFPGRAGWPAQLRGADFPPALFVRGTLEPHQKRVAIVGSRRSDEYGAQIAAFFSGALSRAGVAVVSGGAVGVDAAAHRAALGNGGRTIAVLGSGVNVLYPSEHAGLFREMVARGGAVVSHFPPDAPGVPQNFKVRNRLIAALSDAVLVARAGFGSGALGTAEWASRMGRPLFAIPGDATCELAAGSNDLLESGAAKAAVGLAPLARALGLQGDRWPSVAPAGGKAVDGAPRSRGAGRAAVPLPEGPPSLAPAAEVPADLRAVHRALGESPIQFDDLLAATGLDAPGLADALLKLEVMGHCEERAGKVFVRR